MTPPRALVALAWTALALPSASCAQEGAVPPDGAVREIGFAPTIQAFKLRDRVAPPPRDAILFIGSSTFRDWEDLEEQMAPLPVFNRAFGGSRTWELLHYMGDVVLPYAPRIVVYYCGANDVSAGESADAIAGRFREFVRRTHAALPETRVFFVSIARAPEKRARWHVVDEVNAQVRAFADAQPLVDYIEINPALSDARGEPRMDLYADDWLHLRRHAYAELAQVIKPILTEAWSER